MKGKNIHCDASNHVPFVIPCLSTSSSTSSTSPTSSSQETVTEAEIPATRRSEKASEDSSARGNSWHESREMANPSKNDDEDLQSDELQGVPDWLQDFKHGLVDESVPEHRDASSFSHELLLEPRAKVVPSKHIIFYALPERPELRCVCLRTDFTRASCRRRTGTVVHRAEHFGDLIAADHKVLTEGCESRHNHRYVVVQDLATQWIQSYPCNTTGSGKRPSRIC